MVDNRFDDDQTRSFTNLVTGTKVSHYTITSKIGAGGMGEVYLAEDTTLKRQVALKFMPAHLTSDSDFKARFIREAEATAKINHPNIVTIYEVSEFNGRPFFAMELVEGQSLRDLAEEKELSIDRIIELAIQICDGLCAAHDKKIVHRDIKPSNIVIDAYGRPKILDFGLAAIQGSEQLTKTGSTLGTVRYMSPEQVEGKEINFRSDLFSLGVVVYELISGRTPFEKENEAATLRSIGQDNPEPLSRYKSDFPEELQRIVSKLLEKDPSLRYQSAAGVMSDLKPLVTQSKGSVAAIQDKQKNRWSLAVGGLSILAVLIIAGIKYWPSDKTEQPIAPTDDRIMLAILPFENLGSKEDEYFADAMTSEITTRVGTLEGIGVIGRTSIVQYKGTKKRASEIGAELNVDVILTGTIQWDKSGETNKIRISPQLIQVTDETQVWADNIQRDLSEIFEVQEEIAISIAEALNLALLKGDQEVLDYRPTENLDAYDYYLRAMNFEGQGGPLRAIALLDKAIELDSNFALAYAMKSSYHSLVAFFSESGFSEHTKPARLAYNKAFEIQPDLAMAHLALGIYHNFIERDYDKALKEFELARQGHVDEAYVLSAISGVKLRQGKWEEAIALDQQVIKLDPRARSASLTSLFAFWYTHQYDRALAAIARRDSLYPGMAENNRFKANIQMCMGAEAELLEQTLSAWVAKGASLLGLIDGPIIFDFLILKGKMPDLDALISGTKSALLYNPDPRLYVYAGLLYRYKGDEESSYLYLDSARIVTENRMEQARGDTSGRFEVLPPNHEVLEMLAMVYSMTDRHDQAIEQAQLAMETMPVEACHW